MAVASVYPHIEKRPGEPARLARVPRVRVAQIAMDYLAHGWSAEEISRQHPNLTLPEVHTAMAYYYDHAGEIDAEIAAEEEELKRLAPGPRPAFLARIRQARVWLPL